MLSRMSSAELTEWQAYEQVSGPFGAERDDVLAAMTALYVVKALGGKKAKLDKMVPQWDRPKEQDWKHMREVFKALTVANGGTVNG